MGWGDESLWRGRLKCNHEGCYGDGHIVEPTEEKGRVYRAWCGTHRPKETLDRAVMIETCLSVQWDYVKKVTLHEMNKGGGPGSYDRKGDIISIEMKDVENVEMMLNEGIEILQFLMLMVSGRNTIHNLGKDGEQNNCWIFHSYRWVRPAVVRIHDKYWGEGEIEDLRKIVRVLAKVHEWELVDETVPLLDRLVQALDVEVPKE